MVKEEVQKTDAKVRLGMLEEAKRELLSKVAEHEKNLKILIAQIKAMQRLIDEAESDIEHEEVERIHDMQEEIDKQTEVLEDMLDKTQKAKEDAREIFGEKVDTLYKGPESSYKINEDVLSTAASGASTNRLRELQYKSSWTEKDAADFFAIKDSVNATTNYELNPFLQENVNETYRAIQDVMMHRQEQIKQNYQTDITKQIQSEQFTRPAFSDQETGITENISTSYKTNYQSSTQQNAKSTSNKESSGLEKKVEK